MSIFVSIAAYRDPQLVATIEDCLAKAADPGALCFGICHQRGDEEPVLPFAADARFRVIDVPWRESRGACWARAAIMGLYGGEDHYLQLDSHHRFVPNWDRVLLDQLHRTGSAKPLLTTYGTAFRPGDPRSFGADPMQMNFDRFTPEGIALFRPGALNGRPARTDPVRARFLSAHLLFTVGSFVREVPYDPALYFIGEEITMAVRAFTSGYDLFHPGELVAWHEYTRDYRAHKHWTDHSDPTGVDVPWYERDRASLARVEQLLATPWMGEYGLGAARTLADYEAYAGVSFRHRKVQDFTRQGLEPPNPPAAPDWAAESRSYDLGVAIDRDAQIAWPGDYDFWYVGFHDDAGRETFRLDAGAEELARVFSRSRDRPLVFHRQFHSERTPVSWTVWPHSRSRGWLAKIEGVISAAARGGHDR